MDTRINLKILGGVATGDNSTGSCILLTVTQGKNTTRMLIDAGLIQCSLKNFAERNREILKELKPELLDFVILTHVHTDHVGRLPLLSRNGFNGKARIICTKATSHILSIMLEDSVKIQTETIAAKARVRKKAVRKNRTSCRDKMTLGNFDKFKDKEKMEVRDRSQPKDDLLYTLADVEKTCSLVKNDGCEYQEWIRLSNKCSLKFYQSGHVLGGAICVIRIKTRNEKEVYLGFSGDLGRRDGIILPPPAIIKEPINYWFTESTYGGQTHPAREDEIKKLIGIVQEAVLKKQKIIIPSFALERAQEIIYLLSYYMDIGIIPKIDIYLDSPMATKITDVFADSWNEGMFADQGKLKFNPFDTEANKFFKVVYEKNDSNDLIAKPGPYIVVAGSGMCHAGRVRSHLRAGLGDPNVNVCLVGYMAEHSLGRKLKNGLPLVNMDKERIIIKAKIIAFESFSAHADSPFLVSYAEAIADKSTKIFIVHGEERSSAFLKLELMEALKKIESDIIIPELNQEIILKAQ